MITCPKCNELNGDTRETCYKCGVSLGDLTVTEKKHCSDCNSLYTPGDRTCKVCGKELKVCDPRQLKKNTTPSDREFMLSILFPTVGSVLGWMYISKGEKEKGKALIITSFIPFIVAVVIVLIIIFIISIT